MSHVGHADSKMTLDLYAQLEQRVKRDHGASFDRLIRPARDLHGDAPTESEASQLVLNWSWPGNRADFGSTEAQLPCTENASEQAKERWRDPESNRGHHNFQTAAKTRG
jgi:hypothetical protein